MRGLSCFQGSRCPDPISLQKRVFFGTDPNLIDLRSQTGLAERIALFSTVKLGFY